jgi:hypothetical protein
VYGDKVDVQYYDAALPEVQEQFREILDSPAIGTCLIHWCWLKIGW